jgi:hypothetical protein
MSASIEVGGPDRLPEYASFYFEAARRLLVASGADVQPVALPLIYLQRHCLELIIKDLLLASSFLSAAKQMAAGKKAIPERPAASHRLVDLVTDLRASLTGHGIPMPADLEPLARDLDALEGSAPDRYRYAFERWTKDQKAHGLGPDESFPTAQRIPISDLQGRLELVIPVADVRDERSLVFALYSQSTDALNQAAKSGNLTLDPKILTSL